MKPVISIGNQDFRSIREKNRFYVDKTSFIKEWWESDDVVTLITRPRRFGKTLNMSMVKQFFSISSADQSGLFEGLSIWQDGTYQELQGSYPVIFLSFASIKSPTYAGAREGIIQAILEAYSEFYFLRDSDALNQIEKTYLDNVRDDMSDAAAAAALRRLSLCMDRHYGKKALILLDEYDTPLQEAYLNGYWDELVPFVRGLFNATFKTNPYLERGLLTGISRVSKESIFSDLNNLKVITTTSERYKTAFGFTEKEVFDALKLCGMSSRKEDVKQWYDGFIFGDQTDIYNPWSITNFLDSGQLDTYWADTSSNALVSSLIKEGTPEMKMEMEDLLAGKEIHVELKEQVSFEQLHRSREMIWSLLLASGYLKPVERSFNQRTRKTIYHLKVTNLETLDMFADMVAGWFPKYESTAYGNFQKALLAGDLEFMNQYMNQISRQTFSSFDPGKRPSDKAEPERFYHGFVLGLIVDLADRYRITSNRESGFGRYDVMLEPLEKDLDAIIIEFKVRQTKEKNLEDTVKAALLQIQQREYDTELLARGIPKERIRHYGFAFEGKKILIG